MARPRQQRGTFSTTVQRFVEGEAPAATKRWLIGKARELHDDTVRRNRAALNGYVGTSVMKVDGVEGKRLEDVQPYGRVQEEFEILGWAIDYVVGLLHQFSPVKTGEYLRAHELLVNGHPYVQGAPLRPGDTAEFINRAPYARRIERGWSEHAPNGVFAAVASIARRRIGKLVKVETTARRIRGGAQDLPAIRLIPRRPA